MTPLSSVPCLRTDLSVLEWAAFPFPEISPTQGSNPGLPHGRRILHQLSHREVHSSSQPSHWIIILIS